MSIRSTASRAEGNTAIDRSKITGVILAGGKGRRLDGQDKGLVVLAGKPLIEHVIERLQPQVGELLINANRNLSVYAGCGFPVVADRMKDFQGPLAGLAAALDAAKGDYVVTAPCDGPLLPADLVSRLAHALSITPSASIAVVSLSGWLQPVYALLKHDVRENLEHFLSTGERRVGKWIKSENMVTVDFSNEAECFQNVNTLQDQQTLEAILQGSD